MDKQKILQIKHYRRIARNFDIRQLRDNRNHLNKIAAINNHLKIEFHFKVLEIGVGTGIHAKYLLEWNNDKDIHFTGVDLSLDMLRVCSERLSNYDNVNLLRMDSECSAFPDNTFDAAYISGSLHHFEDCFKGISEMIRCIKPNSKFAIMEPNWIFPYNFLSSKITPAEKNISLMKKANFEKWMNSLPNLKYNIENFAYTPPFPRYFINSYDRIDPLLINIPIIQNMSIMIFVKGQKLN